ncbi:MAG: ATP-binding protein [Desulfopila sp.]|nr:ATP-binding protein [Desulfopila sp.]
MFPSLNLRTRIICLFLAMGAVTLSGGIAMLHYTYQFDNTFNNVVQKEIALYTMAKDMEVTLANQKGFITYFLIDGNSKWLESLGQYRQIFQQNLDRAGTLQLSANQQNTLARIKEKYRIYIESKDITIKNYQANLNTTHTTISGLHEKNRELFFNLLELCQSFSRNQWNNIEEIRKINAIRSENLRKIAYATISFFMMLSALSLYILYKQILLPIRGLAIETGSTPQESSKDEIFSLSQSLKGMMRDFDETHDELAKSRKHLLQAERMAMVGELAAGVAHTIRNPFTSIKMRMFSLTRSLHLNDEQNDDIKVISDEITRIDKIVQNFLEFSRPPKLKLEAVQLFTIIHSVIALMEYRLKKYDADLIYRSLPDLPKIHLDPDRIKEALVNLITNSCEAMEKGGVIEIDERIENDPEAGDMVVISVRDNGPGVPESIRYRITAPFFTTKEDGTGLGLSIVKRIVQEHGGKLEIPPSEEKKTEFIIKIPIQEGTDESGSDN